MDWLKAYRPIIESFIPNLRSVGFSYLGEDGSAMKFMNAQVALTFSVEPFSEDLTVLVKFLSNEKPDDTIYALHLIMELVDSKLVDGAFEVKAPQDMSRIVRQYVEFIVRNKDYLFSESFPLAAQYRHARAKDADVIRTMLERHSPPTPKS